MIKFTQSRVKQHQECFGPDVYTTTSSDALQRFVIYELGYGGQITDIQYEKDRNFALVSVQTVVLGCIDTTVFEGPIDEMQLLVEVAVLAHKNYGLSSEDSLQRVADDVMRVTKGNPLFINLCAGMIAGQHTLRNICMSLAGVDANNDPLGLGALKFQDMLAAISMAHEGECTLEEAVALAS